MDIKKGDTIKVLTGRDRNKTAKVVKVFTKNLTILVENVNLVKKHLRPKKEGEKGQVVSLARPLSVHRVMLVCSACGKATRTNHRLEGDKKVRICKKCHSQF